MWGSARRFASMALSAVCALICGSTLAMGSTIQAAPQAQHGGDFLEAVNSSLNPSASRVVDWENRDYSLTCDDTVKKPVKLAIRNGKGITKADGIGGYDRWEVEVQRTARGKLPHLGNVTAVLFYCSPQPSNFFTQELRVYSSNNGSEIARTPHLSGGDWLPPEYQPESVAIRKDRIVADLKFYGPGDPHGSPSRLRHLSWTWNGRKFVTHEDHERVTVNGMGPLKLDMSRAEAAKAIGMAIPGKESRRVCTDFSVQDGPEGLLLRFTSDRLVAIYVIRPATTISTLSGIHIGSARDDVLDTYDGEITVTTPDYGGEELVFAPSAPEFAGKVIRFGMSDGAVETFIAGERDWAVFAPSCGAPE